MSACANRRTRLGGTLVGGQGCSLFEVLLGGASSDHDIVISGGVYE